MKRRRGAANMTAMGLGAYAGALGVIHGVCELMQGAAEPEGPVFYAVGPPCRPDAVWHGCLPAMTVLPSLLYAGLATVLFGALTAAWSVWGVRRKGGGIGLILLSALMLLAGGGFVAPFTGVLAGRRRAAARQGKTESEGIPRRTVALASGGTDGVAPGGMDTGVFLWTGYAAGRLRAVYTL